MANPVSVPVPGLRLTFFYFSGSFADAGVAGLSTAAGTEQMLSANSLGNSMNNPKLPWPAERSLIACQPALNDHEMWSHSLIDACHACYASLAADMPYR